MNHKVRDAISMLVGTCIGGFSIACFITPGKIVSGGVTGLATILYHLKGWDTGVMMLILSIPLFILGLTVFGKAYVVKGMVGITLFSLFATLFGRLTNYNGLLPYEDIADILFSAIFGGALFGAGVGLVLRTGANTGGTDIIAQILNKYTPLPLGTCLMLTDSLIIAAGGFAFGFKRALFGIIAMYISGKTINYVVMSIGTKYAKAAYIFSPKNKEIGDRIIKELHHGGTIISGNGIYSGNQRQMLLAVVHNQQINKLQDIVQEEDPDAFMFVQETYEVLGQGFVPIYKEGKQKKGNSELSPKTKIPIISK
ncbi:MAG: YitT family protein [Sphaerochaetaceae bacterium]